MDQDFSAPPRHGDDESLRSPAAGLPGRAAVGHPVDVASGSVFTAAHDFDLPGTMPLIWRRYYATDSAARTVLGPRWTTAFLMSLEVHAAECRLITDSGSAIRFPLPESPLVVGDRVLNAGSHMELWRRIDGYTVVHWHHGDADLHIWNFVGIEGVLPLTSIENAAGHRFTVLYDTEGRPTAIEQEIEQRRVAFEYDRRGLLESLRLDHATGPTTLVRYTYDASGMLETATDAMGAVTRYAYDAEGRMVAEQNPLGSTFHFSYDARGRCDLTAGDGGREYRKLRFHPSGRMTDVTDGSGRVRRYVFNSAGQVLQEISPTGVVRTTEYDATGHITREVNVDGSSRAYEYDSEGNRVGMTFEDGSTVRMAYNARHALISYTDALGNVWELERDERNQLVAVVNPLGYRFVTPRDTRGFVTARITPLGREAVFAVGPALSWMQVSDEIGVRFRFDYDDFGNIVAYYDAEGVREVVRYDLRNRPIEAEDALGRVWTWRYNALGEVTEHTSGRGITERMEYDTFGQLVAHHTALGVVRLAYDLEGRLTDVVNRRGEQYACEYDADGRVVRERFFDGREERYEWNDRGQLTQITLADGDEISYRYNPTGDVISVRSTRGLNHRFEYDPRGHLVAASAPGSRLETVFDEADRLVREVQNGHVIENEYDADNFCIGRSVLGMRIGFAYDARGRLTAISDAQGVVQELRWNALGLLVERTGPSGVVERLTRQRDGLCLTQTIAVAGRERIERRYAYDRFGRVATLSDTGAGQLTYEYDAIGRIVGVRDPEGPRESYAYDPIGVITGTHRGPRAIGPNGRTLGDGERRYTYDPSGMVVSVLDLDGTERRYAYDSNGQLQTATRADGVSVAYTYDALGRRIARRVADDGMVEYLYAGPVLVGERNAGIGTRLFAGDDWPPFAEWHDGERQFVVSDLTRVTREVLDGGGSTVWSAAFEVYGRTRNERGARADRHRFPGQFADGATGLVYNFYRDYDATLGAYLTPDPIGLEGGADHYGYPRNPFLWTDPFGLKCAAHKAEENMGKYFNSKGYKKISVRGKDLNAPGLDGVYMAKDGKGPPLYIIAEAKSSQSGRLGSPASGQQMSDAWINTGMNGAPPPKDRLTLAVGPKAAQEIRDSGSVQKAVYHQPGGAGPSTVTDWKGGAKPYDPNGTTDTF